MIFHVLFLLLLPQPNHGMGFMGIFQDLKLSKNSSADPCRAENLKVSFFFNLLFQTQKLSSNL